MANSRKGYPALLWVIVAIILVLACTPFAMAVFGGKSDSQKSCEAQGGFYKTNGGCDLPPSKKGY